MYTNPNEFADTAEEGVYVTDQYDDLYIIVFPGEGKDGNSMIVEVNLAEDDPHIIAFDADAWLPDTFFSPVAADVLLDIGVKGPIPATRFLVKGETIC